MNEYLAISRKSQESYVCLHLSDTLISTQWEERNCHCSTTSTRWYVTSESSTASHLTPSRVCRNTYKQDRVRKFDDLLVSGRGKHVLDLAWTKESLWMQLVKVKTLAFGRVIGGCRGTMLWSKRRQMSCAAAWCCPFSVHRCAIRSIQSADRVIGRELLGQRDGRAVQME